MDKVGHPASEVTEELCRVIGLRHGMRPEVVATVLQSYEAMQTDGDASSRTRDAEADLIAREQRLPPHHVDWILESYEGLRAIERSVRQFIPVFKSTIRRAVDREAVIAAMTAGAQEAGGPEHAHLPPRVQAALGREIAMTTLIGPRADQRTVTALAERMREFLDEANGAASRVPQAAAVVKANRGKDVHAEQTGARTT